MNYPFKTHRKDDLTAFWLVVYTESSRGKWGLEPENASHQIPPSRCPQGMLEGDTGKVRKAQAEELSCDLFHCDRAVKMRTERLVWDRAQVSTK
jgi:hypothetical protein